MFYTYLVILAVYGLVFTIVRPSRSCGPWRFQQVSSGVDFSIFNQLNYQLKVSLPESLYDIIDVVFSTSFMISLAIVMLWVQLHLFVYNLLFVNG